MTKFETSDYQTIKKALVNRDLKQALYDEGKVIMEGVLLTLHGQEHHQRRKLEHKVFQRDFFKYYEHELFPKTLNETISPFLRKGSADLLDFGYRITMNLTADFAGIDRFKKTPEETENLLILVKIFSQGATLVHSKRPHDEVNMEVTEALGVFEEKFLIPSKNRRLKILKQFNDNKLNEDDLPRDVLTVLLRNVDGINLDDDLIKREIAFYLQAGSHSTANSMVHALHEILVVAVQLYVIDVVEGFRCAFLPEKGFTRAVNHGVNFLVRGTHPHGYLGRDRGFRQIDHHRAGHTRHLCQIVIAGLTASFRIR